MLETMVYNVCVTGCSTLDTIRQPRAPKWIKYDQRLQKIADDFVSYTNVLDYLKAVGNMTMLK